MAALATLLVAAACSDMQSQSQASATGAAPEPAATLPSSSDAISPGGDELPAAGSDEPSDDELEVTVVGGRWAGSYRFRGDMGCGYTPTFSTWSVQMWNGAPKTVSEMRFATTVPFHGGRAETGTFEASFGAGNDPDRVDYLAREAVTGGKGVSFVIERQGSRATIRATGADDATDTRYTATIRCATVSTYQ